MNAMTEKSRIGFLAVLALPAFTAAEGYSKCAFLVGLFSLWPNFREKIFFRVRVRVKGLKKSFFWLLDDMIVFGGF